jgi:hypothetical protein
MSRQDEKVFAEARELAQLRLEQCIADWQIFSPAFQDVPVPCESRPLRRFQKLS